MSNILISNLLNWYLINKNPMAHVNRMGYSNKG